MGELKRNCPKCNKEVIYSRSDIRLRAERENRRCFDCTMKSEENSKKVSNGVKNAIKRDPTIIQRMKEKLKGRKIPVEIIKKRVETRKKNGYITSIETKRKQRESNTGKKRSEEAKQKMSKSAIKRIQKYQIYNKPNFNPRACEFINILNKSLNINLQHALNGGEKWIKGFYLDGYDKEKNIIFEYDEKYHTSSKLKKKDLERQEKLIDEVNPLKFIRYDEKNNRLYDVLTEKDISI